MIELQGPCRCPRTHYRSVGFDGEVVGISLEVARFAFREHARLCRTQAVSVMSVCGQEGALCCSSCTLPIIVLVPVGHWCTDAQAARDAGIPLRFFGEEDDEW